MSERIRVDWEQMEDTAVQLKRLSDLLNSVSSRIRGVRIDQRSGAELELSFSAGRLSSTGTTIGCGTVEECLKSLSAGVGALNEHTASLSGRIEQAANLFADNEKRLAHSFGTILTPGEVMSLIGGSMGYGTDPAAWTPETRSLLQKQMAGAQLLHDADITCLIKEGEAILLGPAGLIATNKWKLGLSGLETTTELQIGNQKLDTKLEVGLLKGPNYKDKVLKPTELFSKNEIYDPRTGQRTEGKLPSGKTLGLFSVGAAASASYSYFEQSIAGQVGNAGFELTGSVGNVEGSASLQGGLGVYWGPDGKASLQTGIEAKSGVSVSAINVEGSMTYELCDQVSLGAKSEVTVGEAEYKTELSAGLIDGKLVASAEGSAEVNLVEVNMEGSFDTDLIDGKVGASVNVGIGAHAKAGYKDGVFVFDVGGSLGVGASISGEIDISGLVDGVAEVGQSVVEGVGSFCAWLIG